MVGLAVVAKQVILRRNETQAVAKQRQTDSLWETPYLHWIQEQISHLAELNLLRRVGRVGRTDRARDS
jgi:hypothetical protein